MLNSVCGCFTIGCSKVRRVSDAVRRYVAGWEFDKFCPQEWLGLAVWSVVIGLGIWFVWFIMGVPPSPGEMRY